MRHGAAGSEGAVLLNVLVDFWLSDADEPLPTSTASLPQAPSSGNSMSPAADGWRGAAASYG